MNIVKVWVKLKEPHLSQWGSLTFLLTFHTLARVIFQVESRMCFIKMSQKCLVKVTLSNMNAHSRKIF
jgi:hypothetical protein